MQPIWQCSSHMLNHTRRRLGLWCALLVSLVALTFAGLHTASPVISTSLTDLLPVTEQDKGASEAARQVTRRVSQQVIFQVSSAPGPALPARQEPAAALARWVPTRNHCLLWRRWWQRRLFN